jgi:hypothetical protein
MSTTVCSRYAPSIATTSRLERKETPVAVRFVEPLKSESTRRVGTDVERADVLAIDPAVSTRR